MSGYCISDAERAAVYGLSHAAQLLYLLGIRPWMDYATGLAGEARRITYQQLREVLTVEPVPGVPATPARSDDQIKRLLAELERRGLIERCSVGAGSAAAPRLHLRVRCLLAEKNSVDVAQDQSVQNQAATRPPLEAATRPPLERPAGINDLPDSAAVRPPQSDEARPPRPPVSGDDGDDPAGERARASQTAFGQRLTWVSRQGWPVMAIQTAKVVAMVRGWADAGVPLEVLNMALDVARRTNGGALPRSPMYLQPVVVQITQQSMGANDGQQRSGANGGRGRPAGRGGVAERCADQEQQLRELRARDCGAAEREG